jgi:hypothetical protein
MASSRAVVAQRIPRAVTRGVAPGGMPHMARETRETDHVWRKLYQSLIALFHRKKAAFKVYPTILFKNMQTKD